LSSAAGGPRSGMTVGCSELLAVTSLRNAVLHV